MTLVPRPAEPEPVALCCGDHGTNDPDVARLWDLMASGLSQPAASRIVWPPETGAASPLLLAAAWVALWVGGCAWAVMSR